MNILDRSLLAVLAATAIAACTTSAGAQTSAQYPARTVTIILPSTTGGNPDVAVRLLAQKLSERLGKPFVVDNKPGAGGNMGTAVVAKAPPDGYTLGLLQTGELSISPHLYRNLSFNVTKDLVPVAAIATVPTVLAVNPAVPAKTLQELIAYAKANPGKLNFGSAGNGSIHHLTASMFAKTTGINMTHVPYKGSSQTVPALVAGDVQLAFVGIPLVKTFAETGRVRLLGISSAKRSKILPAVPALAEQGLPGFDVVARLGIFAPGGTSAEIRSFLRTEIANVLAEPDTQKRLLDLGMELEVMSAEQYEQALREDFRRFEQAVRETGLKLD